jgi:hypothetical protein
LGLPVAVSVELLFAETYRQLGELREQADSIAMRAGLLITVTGLAAACSLLIWGGPRREILAFVAFGLASLAGVATIVPNLETGPHEVDLMNWFADVDTNNNDALAAKLVALRANRQRLIVMNRAFYAQALAALGAVIEGFPTS